MWSPWRSKHIERMADAADADLEAVFSLIGQDTHRDEENLVLWRGESLFVVMNLFPYNNGHLLIVPYRAVENYEDLSAGERSELADTIGRCIRWLNRALRPDGFNVGINIGEAGGAGIPGHIHTHVVPRWSADTNFMTTAADLKVIPESMEDTYRKLRNAVLTDQDADDR